MISANGYTIGGVYFLATRRTSAQNSIQPFNVRFSKNKNGLTQDAQILLRKLPDSKDEALSAADLKHKLRWRRWPRQRVLAAIQELQQAGMLGQVWKSGRQQLGFMNIALLESIKERGGHPGGSALVSQNHYFKASGINAFA